MIEQPRIEEFQKDWDRYTSGLMSENEANLFKACWGLHVTRDGGWILKFRFPGGQMSPEQAEGLAGFLRKWVAEARARITPRQNIQVFDFAAEKLPLAMADLASFGLSTWRHPGAGMSTSSLCEKGAYCENSKLDPRPLLNALETWLGEHGKGYPAKFKVAFSACGNDCAYAGGHDVGLVATENEKGEKGYQVMGGGRLGEEPRPAFLLKAFVSETAAGPFLGSIVEAAKKLAKGNARARLGYILEEIGVEAFLAEAAKFKVTDFPKVEATAPKYSDPSEDGIPMTTGEEYRKFLDTNVFTQKDGEHLVAVVRVPFGWVTAAQWEVLAKVSRDFSNGELRLTQSQNIMIPMIHESNLQWVHYDLNQFGLGLAGAGYISDLSCCPGPKACDNAQDISAHEALAQFFALGDLGLDPGELAGAIKVSSCPNKCGNPELGSLALIGASWGEGAMKETGYKILMGGGKNPAGMRIGREVGACRAVRLGSVLRSLMERFKEEKHGDENFHQFCQRVSEGDPSPAQMWLQVYTDETGIGEPHMELVDGGA